MLIFGPKKPEKVVFLWKNALFFAENVHKTRKLISMTTSTLDDVTTFNSEINEEMDEETVLMTWEDVTIKLTDVDVMTKIGDGRFGSVYFGGYHGNAAVRFVNMNYLSQEDRRADVFATEIVSAYKVWDFGILQKKNCEKNCLDGFFKGFFNIAKNQNFLILCIIFEKNC